MACQIFEIKYEKFRNKSDNIIGCIDSTDYRFYIDSTCTLSFDYRVQKTLTSFIFLNCSSLHSFLQFGCWHFLKNALTFSSSVSRVSESKTQYFYSFCTVPFCIAFLFLIQIEKMIMKTSSKQNQFTDISLQAVSQGAYPLSKSMSL